MQFSKMRISSSLIGDFGDFLYHNIDELKKLYVDFDCQTKTEKLPDGREVSSCLVTKNNVTAKFTPGRIDYVYNFPNSSTTIGDVLNATQSFYKTLSKRFPDVSAARIAVVITSIIDNENDAAVEYLTRKFGLTAVFGNSNELQLKINNPIVSFEQLNSVLEIAMGEAKNNKTQERKKVLLVTSDVNTLATNKQNRFFAINCDKQFETLFELADEKTSNLEKL